MIIMQSMDATERRQKIEAGGLAKVIYSHKQDDSICVQYHPKGIKGEACYPKFLIAPLCKMSVQ